MNGKRQFWICLEFSGAHVANRLKAPAMNRRWSKPPQSFHVCNATVSLMMRKAVFRVGLIELDHHRVTCDFRENRSRSNRDTKLITFNDRSLLRQFFRNGTHLKKPSRDHLIAIDKQTVGHRPKSAKRFDHRE